MRRAVEALASLSPLRIACARRFATGAEAPVHVVFGASGGIGAALAARLVQQQSQVILCGRDEAKLDALVKRIGGGIPFVADGCYAAAAEAAVQKAVKDFGHVDGVANCIGSLLLKSAHITSEAEFRGVWETNVMSAFHVVKAAVRAMMKAKDNRGGSIVLFSSVVARHGLSSHEAIAAAKAGVYGLALSTAASYASKNIRVNCVAPGMTDTPLAAKITGNASSLAASVAMHPLKRIGKADEPAALAAFLLNPQNSFITGQFIGVDGGLGSLK